MIIKSKFFHFLIMAVVFISCEKQEGPGGLSTIQGTLMMRVYNDDMSQIVNEYPATDENVYITYGDDPIFGDDVETNYNGYFEFDYLQEGSYTVWYYSDDTASSSPSGEIVTEKTVDLGRKQVKDLGTLYTNKIADWDDGTSTVSGTVMLINYINSAVPPYNEYDIKDITPAQETDVYLLYGSHEVYDERFRTHYNGRYQFNNLIKGEYTVFVYSEELQGGIYNRNSDNIIFEPASNGTFDFVVYQTFEITSDYQTIELDTFYIEQE